MGNRTPLFVNSQPGGLYSVVDTRMTTGNIWYVDSGASGGGDTTGHGQNPDSPFLTLDYAVGQCTANNGDVIFVLPGHAETVTAAAGLDLDVAGITIHFLGEGNARGSITFSTVVGADMDVDAADITVINPRFVAGIDALTGPIDVNAARFKIVNGTWQDGTTINTTDCIVADANADDMTIDGWEFIDGDAAGTQKQSAIQIAAATRPVLKRIRVTGDFGTGVIENGTAWIDSLLDDVVIDNANASPTVGILLQATSSGAARNVHVRVASGTTYVTANNDMQWFDCWGVGTDADAAAPIGTLEDSASNYVGTDSANNTAATTNVAANEDGSVLERLEQIQEAVNRGTGTSLAANKSIADALGTDGTTVTDAAVSVLGAIGADNANNAFASTSVAANEDGSVLERLEQIQEAINKGTGTAAAANKSLLDALGFDGGAAIAASAGMLRTAAGSIFVVKKTLTSSAVVQAGVDVTAVSTVGDIQLIDVLLQCDATGLAAGTNFTLECNNTKGSAVFLSTAVSGLGANAVMDLDSASVTSKTVVLESGKKIIAKSTVADCTGAGTVDVYLICRRLADNATLTAAA